MQTPANELSEINCIYLFYVYVITVISRYGSVTDKTGIELELKPKTACDIGVLVVCFRRLCVTLSPLMLCVCLFYQGALENEKNLLKF